MSERPAPRGRPRLIVTLLVLAAVIAVIDQATKYLAEDRLTPGVVVPLIGDYLGLQLIYNPGAAFSLATGMTWVLTIIMVVVIVVVLRVARRLRSTAWTVALGLLLGGALGNLYDRLLRDPGFGRGHVVDFINYNGWFVGNVADIAIVAAAVLIALLALLGREVDGTRSGAPESADPAAESPEEDSEPEYSPHVPQPSSEGADVASWAAGAPAVHAAGTSSVAEPEPAADSAGEPQDPDSVREQPDADADAAEGGVAEDEVAPAWRPVRSPAGEPAPAPDAETRAPGPGAETRAPEPDAEAPVADAEPTTAPDAEPTTAPAPGPVAEPAPASVAEAPAPGPDAEPAPADEGANAAAEPPAPAAPSPPSPPSPPRPPRRPSRREIRLAERDRDG